MAWRWTSIKDYFFNTHDRVEELKVSVPDAVREASHELSNATMAAEGSLREVRRQADVLTDLVHRMQLEDRRR